MAKVRWRCGRDWKSEFVYSNTICHSVVLNALVRSFTGQQFPSHNSVARTHTYTAVIYMYVTLGSADVQKNCRELLTLQLKWPSSDSNSSVLTSLYAIYNQNCIVNRVQRDNVHQCAQNFVVTNRTITKVAIFIHFLKCSQIHYIINVCPTSYFCKKQVWRDKRPLYRYR